MDQHDLTQKLIGAHDSERTRIARELHDDIAQRLAILTMELDGLSQSLPLPVTDLRERIRGISERALQLGRDIQTISHRLHAYKLEYLGIVGASAIFCREVSDRYGMDVQFASEAMPQAVPQEAALCLFRVLQEAVTNAAAHAGVREISVTLAGKADGILLEVVDRGRGFDVPAATAGSGLGLITIQERVAAVHGVLSIESRPGAGTMIRARVPLALSSLASA